MAKICLVNFNVYVLIDPTSKASMGGAELDLFTLATQIQSEHEVSIITGDWGQEVVKSFQQIRIFRSVRLGGHNYLMNGFRLWQTLKRVNADIYVSAGAGPEVAIFVLFCRFYHKKYVYRQVSSIDTNGEYIHSYGFSGKLFRWGLERVNKVVLSVREHGDLLRKNHSMIANSSITYISLAIPQETVNIRHKTGVLWVSRCVPMKNPEIFLELATSFPNEQFVMICPSQSQEMDFFNEIKERAEKLGNVEFHNFVPFAKIQHYFNNAKVFVNTSDFEGFTLTLLQSGAAHTPVLYYKVDPDGVITRHSLGGFASGDKEQLHKMLKKLLDDQQYWNNCSISISEYVGKEHSLVKIKQQWLDLIASLIG